jgi:hypothetical protein
VVLTVQTALNGREMKDEELYRLKMELVRRLYASGINPDKIRKIMVFLRFYVRFENSKLMNNFDKEIAVFTKNRESMGIEEFLLDRAKKEGIQETLNKVISQLLTKQFSPEQIAEMLDVPVSFVLSIKEEDTENE